MQTHDLQQGSPAGHEFRATHFGASEASAMLGLSKYTTRSELLLQKHTGISKDLDAATQARFNKGHQTEELARQLIEKMIGEPLSPVTLSDGNLSCSCDGLTFGDDIAWEHKLWSKSLAAAVVNDDLPEAYMPQCQQVVMITGAAKLIFTCSDGTEQNMVSMDVLPDPAWFERIRTGWAAFLRDLSTYTPPEVVEKPIPTAVIALPALQVQIRGEVTASNMPAFIDAADAFLGRIKTVLADDQDFADADANIKACDTAEKGIEQAKKAITAQAADNDTIMRTMDLYRDKLRDVRLKLTKLVDSEKLARKTDIVSAATIAFSAHVKALEDETRPIQLNITRPDFAGATKNKRTITYLKEAVNNTLVKAKIEADAVAKDIRSKLAWFSAAVDISESNPASLRFLFPDLQQIIGKQKDDFVLLVNTRIETHKKSEADKIERIRAEEEAKARAKVEAEARAKAEEEASAASVFEAARIKAENEKTEAAAIEDCRKQAHDSRDYVEKDFGFPAPSDAKQTQAANRIRPDDKEIIEALQGAFGPGVTYGMACDWIL